MPIATISTTTLAAVDDEETKVSTDSLENFEDSEADKSTETEADDDKVDLTSAEDRLEESLPEGTEELLTVIESFMKLFPTPSGDQIKSLADAFLLEGEDREDFMLMCVDAIAGDENVLDGDEGDDDDDDDDEEIDDDDRVLDDEDAEGDSPAAEHAALIELASLATASDDPLTEVLNHDGAPVNLQPNVDDQLMGDDGEVDFNTITPSEEPPFGANDGEPSVDPDATL